MTIAAPVKPLNLSHLLGLSMIALVALVWGSMFTVVKTLTPHLSTPELLFWRYALAALPLLPCLFRAPRQARVALWRDGAILGTLMFMAAATQTAGLAYTSANRAAFITGLSVVLVPLSAAFLTRQRKPKAVWIGAGLCLTGLASLSLEGGTPNVGDALVLGTAVTYTAYVLVMSRVAHRHAAFPLTAVSILTTALLSLLVPAQPERGAGHSSCRNLGRADFRQPDRHGRHVRPASQGATSGHRQRNSRGVLLRAGLCHGHRRRCPA